MNGRERTLKALNLEIPDRVPMYDWFDEPLTIGVAEKLGLLTHHEGSVLRRGDETEESVHLYCSVVDALSVDCTSNVYGTGFEAIDADYGRDRYGRTFLLSEHGEPGIWSSEVKTVQDLKNYDMVGRIEDKDFDGIRMVQKALPDRAHALNAKGPFHEAWLVLGGMDKLLFAFATDPVLVHETMRTVVEFTKELYRIAKYNLKMDFIVMDGDLCGNDYTLMSHDHFREFIFPYKKELIDYAHGLGMKVVKHSDGMVWSLIDDFIELGIDGFHPVQPQCMDLAQTKAYLFGKMAVCGNVDCLETLVTGTPDDVIRESRQVIETGAPGGGYIFCSSNSLHPGCKPENVIAMFEAGLEYGNYANISTSPKAAPPPPDTTPKRSRRQTSRRKAVSNVIAA
ncbi:uroporphyrinogen decarboxylase family protein [Roseovarius sp. 2305UL8-3]|uniref:uroporphyrinogen decarboxylase family protein n=1 Tax=Roseovarius conchicola TaxID=3121636 RepID=UPI0035286CFE